MSLAPLDEQVFLREAAPDVSHAGGRQAPLPTTPRTETGAAR